MEAEEGNSYGITGVILSSNEQKFASGTIDRAVPKIVLDLIDYPNTRDDYISSLHHSIIKWTHQVLNHTQLVLYQMKKAQLTKNPCSHIGQKYRNSC